MGRSSALDLVSPFPVARAATTELGFGLVYDARQVASITVGAIVEQFRLAAQFGIALVAHVDRDLAESRKMERSNVLDAHVHCAHDGRRRGGISSWWQWWWSH